MVLKMATDACMDSDDAVMFAEHVQVKVSLTYSRRGDLQLDLMSPSGTSSTLLPRRKDDYQPGKLDAWHFLSVFYWGERPNGTWTLNVQNGGSELNSGNVNRLAVVTDYQVHIRGATDVDLIELIGCRWFCQSPSSSVYCSLCVIFLTFVDYLLPCFYVVDWTSHLACDQYRLSHLLHTVLMQAVENMAPITQDGLPGKWQLELLSCFWFCLLLCFLAFVALCIL